MRPLESEVGVALTKEEALAAVEMHEVVWNNWVMTGMHRSFAEAELQIPAADENHEVRLKEPVVQLLWKVAFLASGIHSQEYLVTSGQHELICSRNDLTKPSTHRYLGRLEEWMADDTMQYEYSKQFALRLDGALFESRKMVAEQDYLPDHSLVICELPVKNL